MESLGTIENVLDCYHIGVVWTKRGFLDDQGPLQQGASSRFIALQREALIKGQNGVIGLLSGMTWFEWCAPTCSR